MSISEPREIFPDKWLCFSTQETELTCAAANSSVAEMLHPDTAWVFWGDSVQLRIGLHLDYISDITVNQRESWLNSIWLEGRHKGDLWYKYRGALLLMPSIQWRKNKRVVTVLPEPTYSKKSILHKLMKGPLFCLCKDDSKESEFAICIYWF